MSHEELLDALDAHADFVLGITSIIDCLKILAILLACRQPLVSGDISIHRSEESFTKVVPVCSLRVDEPVANDGPVFVEYDPFHYKGHNSSDSVLHQL